MNASNLFLILTVLLAFCAWYQNREDSKQKNRIEELGTLNKNLTKEVEKLAIINNQLALQNTELGTQNINLSVKTNTLIEETQQLTSISKSLIEKVDLRTEKYSLENALFGSLDLYFVDKLKDDEDIVVHFGSYTYTNSVKMYRSENPPTMMSIEGRALMPFRVVDHKLKVNLTVYDLGGNLVVEIVNNSWRRNPNNTGKFNYDNRGFEIIDNRGFVAINVNLVSNKEIAMQGYLLDRNSGILTIGGESKHIIHPLPRTFNEIEELFKLANIKQLFNYDRENWLGSRR